MTCTVYYSKSYALGGLAVVLGFAAVVARLMPHTHAPWFVPWTFAALVSIALAASLHSLVTTRWIIQVDGTGIRDSRDWFPSIEWGDVIAVERAPLVQRQGDETTHHIRDAWRPLYLTVRNPDKYLLRIQKIFRSGLASHAKDPGHTVIQLNLTGLTPGSDVVETCIRQNLARLGRPCYP